MDDGAAGWHSGGRTERETLHGRCQIGCEWQDDDVEGEEERRRTEKEICDSVDELCDVGRDLVIYAWASAAVSAASARGGGGLFTLFAPVDGCSGDAPEGHVGVGRHVVDTTRRGQMQLLHVHAGWLWRLARLSSLSLSPPVSSTCLSVLCGDAHALTHKLDRIIECE
jgi:hypothetical protein